jgi:hypothetical protein
MLATTTMTSPAHGPVSGISPHHELIKLPTIHLHAHRPPHSHSHQRPKQPLVKISNSERAKFYRRQHKERTRVLAATVTTLRRDVQQLDLQTQLLRGLVSCDLCGPPRAKIQTQLHAFFANPKVALPGFTIESRQLGSVAAYGTSLAPVIEVSLELEGMYPAASLEAIYYSIPGNTVLLDMLMHSRMRYECLARLSFTAHGDCETWEVDVDWVSGLLECVGCIRDVHRVVGPFQRLGKPTLEL